KAIMMAQYRFATREPNEFVKFYMCEHDTNTWYTLLHGIDGDELEFKGGEYLVRIELPDDFPRSAPPRFYFMTPQGLYDVEKIVCISIGEFHKDKYRSVLGVAGFCSQL